MSHHVNKLLILISTLLLVAVYVDFKLPFYRVDPQRFEQSIDQFEQADSAKQINPNGVVLYGSSSIKAWSSIAEAFPHQNIVVRGFGGSMMHDLLFYFDRVVLPHQPASIIIYAGENDVSAHVWPKTIKKNLVKILDKVTSKLPHTQVYFIAIKPSPARWSYRKEQKEVNLLIEQLAKQSNRLNYIEIESIMLDKHGLPEPSLYQKDGIHLSDKGYALWTRLVSPIITHRD